jgi:putative pyruvate formate lyase activating enzyme
MLDLTHGLDPDRLATALAWAEERYGACDVCARACGVDRHGGERGLCGLGVAGRVYKEYLHFGEEQALLPSHTIFLTGCSLRCAFCSDDGPVRQPLAHGHAVAPEALAARIARRRREGATNVNFVGGVPDVNLLYILRALSHCPSDTHVVWNTNLWTTPATIAALTGVVGTWLADLKFGNDRCAKKLAGVDAYTATLRAALPLAARAGNLLVRHLVMPGHLGCCTAPALAWLSEHLPGVPVNLMTGYLPFQLAGAGGPMGARLAPRDRAAAVALLAGANVTPLVDGRGIAAAAPRLPTASSAVAADLGAPPISNAGRAT